MFDTNTYFDTVYNKKAVFNPERFFEISADLLCVAGYDGYFKKLNPAVSKTLGYTDEELLASPINSFVHVDDRNITSEKREAIKNNNPLLHFENRYVTKSGEIIWLSWTSMPVKEEQLVFAIAKVITHKKKIEEERNLLLNSITKINNDLKQLSYTTSHDLRLPVSNLISIFDLIDLSKIEDEETMEFMEMLKYSAEGLKRSLNEYVDALNRHDILDIQTEDLDLNECLAAAMGTLGSLIQGSKASIDADFSVFPIIKFNKSYLESIFLNLITNSIKYTKPGKSPVIKICTLQKDGLKQLIFADEGLGFDMEHVKDKIFGLNQKFTNHADSKGIGLYLVHNHVKNLGGNIKLESSVNGGARFIITFSN